MAVFAGLAEVSATIALPRLAGKVQEIFVWFTVGFPFAIVIPFFLFLAFRPRNLYVPGDYRKDPVHLTGEVASAPGRVTAKTPKSKPLPSLRESKGLGTAQ